MLDTIIAQATPPGRGGIGILRISGTQVKSVAQSILGSCPKPRYADYRYFYDSEHNVIDRGISIFFPNPHSFTGEDILELHAHGGPVLLDILMKNILKLPKIRTAKPGEFSERAFLNGKIDLTQAEAIADLIDAQSEHSVRAAMRSLQGFFALKIHQLAEQLINLRIVVESTLDFPEENIEHVPSKDIETQLISIIDDLNTLYKKAQQGKIIREGIKVVIAGRPNAGKSTVMNALTGEPTAIVTSTPGTTRDVLRELIRIEHIPLQLTDTAGLHQTDNEIELLGIERAWSEIAQADHLILVVDSSTNQPTTSIWPELAQRLPNKLTVTIVYNKIDLINESASVQLENNFKVVRLSAQSGDGIDLLRQELKAAAGWQTPTAGSFLARRRHLQALRQCIHHLQCGANLPCANELLAESLRLAHKSLEEITGQFSSDELLGKIFSSFCIGK